MGYAIEALTQHTHELEPVVLYNFPQTVIVLDSIAFEEEWYGGHLIDGLNDIQQSEVSHKVLLPSSKFSWSWFPSK